MTTEKKSGKQATKGQKQIVEENAATLAFYRNMILITVTFYSVICAIFWSTTLASDLVLISVCGIAQFCCFRFMAYMARAKYSPTGQLLDGGIDLNMESGIAEHVKDAIILSSITQVLAAVSSYFWLILLVIPCRVFQMLWKNFIGPWFFQKGSSEEQEVVDDKKQRKLERRLRRQQN